MRARATEFKVARIGRREEVTATTPIGVCSPKKTVIGALARQLGPAHLLSYLETIKKSGVTKNMLCPFFLVINIMCHMWYSFQTKVQ